MTYLAKDGKRMPCIGPNMITLLKADGWTEAASGKEEGIDLETRVAALEDAVTDIATEVYKDG